jgi:hypothetical protein
MSTNDSVLLGERKPFGLVPPDGENPELAPEQADSIPPITTALMARVERSCKRIRVLLM